MQKCNNETFILIFFTFLKHYFRYVYFLLKLKSLISYQKALCSKNSTRLLPKIFLFLLVGFGLEDQPSNKCTTIFLLFSATSLYTQIYVGLKYLITQKKLNFLVIKIFLKFLLHQYSAIVNI